MKKGLRESQEGPSHRAATLEVPVDGGETMAGKSARLITEGVASNAFVSMMFCQYSGVSGGDELSELVKSTRQTVEANAKGGSEQAEALLTSQAIALNSVFLEMSRRAAINMGSHLGAMETYMRLALKAQSQCRTTLESLAEIKNPRAVAFVKQANIAGGHQQVNNPAPESPGQAPERTGRAGRKRQQNRLLEDVQDAQWLDPRAAPAASAGDPEMATVGAVDGASHQRGQGKGRPERLEGRGAPRASRASSGAGRAAAIGGGQE